MYTVIAPISDSRVVQYERVTHRSALELARRYARRSGRDTYITAFDGTANWVVHPGGYWTEI